jgi:mannose-6-phosphate isomerase-like protein (cupin superfamily)
MTTRRFEDFATQARAEGFDEVLERVWPAQTVLETHTHAFAVRALLVEGEMWLTLGGETRHLVPGDEFAVEHGVPHAERYGDAGARYWVARRTAVR